MRKIILCFIALLLLPAYMSGQMIKGKVVDKSGMGIPGATVLGKDPKFATSTDLDGIFTIKAQVGELLRISYVGLETITTKATDSFITITMEESKDNELKEVVVIGYGSAKKRDLTGSIVKVDGKSLVDKPNPNPIVSIQGKVAGLSIVNTGKPGQDPDIRIRGTASRYNTKPLYVIDGLWTDDINFINPNDIESIEVLKDASSLAIFGARGANGVIIVSTKKAKTGKTTINYATSLSLKSISGKPSLTNAEQFKTLYDEQRVNQGVAPYGSYGFFTGNTDWIDAIKNSSANMRNHTISISNGTEKNKFYLGAGYVEEEGLIKNENFKKFTFNLNNELELSDAIKIGVNIAGTDLRLPQLKSFSSALNATPIVSPFNDAMGLYNQLPIEIGGAQVGNPLVEAEAKKNTSLNRNTRYVASVFTEIKFLNDFKFRASYLTDLTFSKGRSYTPVINVYAAEVDETTLYGSNALTGVNQFSNNMQKLQQDYLLTYTKSLGNHNITVLAGNTRYDEIFSGMSGSVKQYVTGDPIPNNPRFWYLDVYPFGDPTTRFANSDEWDRANVSYFGRLLYNFNDKYTLNASYRRDGSSDLKKWQNFWTLGAAWDVAKESFMANQNVFDQFKIRGSYGNLGNQFTSIHYPTYPNYTTGSTAVFGETLVPAYILAYRNNPNLKWETVTSYEGGIDFTSLNNRLKAEVTYFNKVTDDLLSFVDLGSEKFYTNAGKIENKGFEFSASWTDKINDDVEYSFSANATTIKNKVKSVYTDGFQVFDGPAILTAGSPIGSFFGYEVEGIYQSYADILTSAPSTLGQYEPGDLKYKDVNGDGVITPDDRKIIGNPTPDVAYGISGSITYKNFSLSADVQGVYGNEVWRDWGNGSTFAQFNFRTERLDRWTGAGTSNWEPRVNDGSGYNKNNSTYMVEDGSYVRLRNIQLGYSFEAGFVNRLKLQSLRLYANAQNLVTWKHNSGFTPEAGGTPTRFGVDNGGYPIPRIVTFGLNASF
jgi:TonB-linked SusC/RagA family outer membrane protein